MGNGGVGLWGGAVGVWGGTAWWKVWGNTHSLRLYCTSVHIAMWRDVEWYSVGEWGGTVGVCYTEGVQWGGCAVGRVR